MFLGLTNHSYIANVDDLLLISRTNSSLIKSSQLIPKSFEEIGLNLILKNVTIYFLMLNIKVVMLLVILFEFSFFDSVVWN